MKTLALRAHTSVSSRFHALTRRARKEDGQTSVEYLGIIVVVVALVGALVVGAGPIAGDIINAIKGQITEITK